MDSKRINGWRGRAVYWHLDEGSMSALNVKSVRGDGGADLLQTPR